MLVWSGCSDVVRSHFIDYQTSDPDFESFAALFADPREFIPAEKKEELPLFIPAEFPDMVPIRRCASNVLRVHLLVVDVDNGTMADFERPLQLVDQYGHVVYTSFSHDPEVQWKFRILVKLSRPVDITEWKTFFPRALDHLGLLALGPNGKTIADLKCADASHMYYLPGGDAQKYQCWVGEGSGLDVDSILQLPLPENYKPPRDEEGPEYIETLPEEERGEISVGLKDYWEGQLQILVNEIYARPYPGSFYDLKSHRVFGIARGCPHILDTERLRTMVRIAIDGRYRNAGVLHHEDVQALREKSHAQVDTAIAEGSSQPWWPPKVNEIPVRPFTELGLAERFVDRHHENVRYEPTWDAWVTWNERHWDQKAGDVLVQENMAETVRKIVDESEPHYLEHWQKKELFKSICEDPNTSDELKSKTEFELEESKKLIEGIRSFALKCETASKISAAVRLARSKPKVLADHQLFNRDPWLLNFRNGTIDLRDGKLREHRRKDYITRIVPYDYDADAKCPMFDKFLSDCMLGNERMVHFLWRAMGYTSIGVTDEQKIFMLHGDGANGKSTFINVMLELFGQHGTGYGFAANSSNVLTNKGAEQHSTWRMDFAGVRFLAMNEVEEGRNFAESTIKELTGSDIITGRRMRQDNWSYKPEFTPWLAMNHLPHVRGTDEGIWRRLVVIEWLANFASIADKNLPRKLLQEAPGIWSRLTREARTWARDGLTLPREVVAASTLYRQEQDPLKDFLERWCVVDKDNQIERANLWAAYEEYCTDMKARTFHERKRFYAAVEKQFTVKIVNGYRFFDGVRLKTPKERIDSMPRSILARALKGDGKPN